jgi:hypothetical protein
MTKSRLCHLIALFLILLPFQALLEQAVAESTNITVSVDHDDGGKEGVRHIKKLLTALNKNGCNAVLQEGSGDGQLLFDSRPVSIAKKDRSYYRLIARAKTLEGKLSVRGAFLVHASTGIEDLNTLQGERIAFVGKQSWSGYRMPLESLHDAGVKEQRDTFFYVGNHVGTLSMLLHSDVFVAVTAESLARRWAQANDLSVVAFTDEVETGGWWIRSDLSSEQIKICAQALSKLERSQHKALPAWIDGFENSE